MSILVIALRAVSLLAFAGPLLLVGGGGSRGERKTRARQGGGERAPLVANLAAFGLFFPSLLIFSGSSEASGPLPLALSGCLVALAGGRPCPQIPGRARSRMEPCPQDKSEHRHRHNWPLSPRAPPHLPGPGTARHRRRARLRQPAGSIYFAVRNCPDLCLARPRGEKLLSRTFGEPYEVYQRRTKMIIPYLL
ncbi:hypothetical protein SAMN04488498_11552 [Mesorhizobium albiziae]|uniref:Uncharacterized protein n=1 Tax=Neomesorhizobium albiziae TaxID=335020 RepID=A0A1I4D2G7_9HYPH|nr:hypothetical protein SAMN04488498_11552 [Mesorhizobium albiziae]